MQVPVTDDRCTVVSLVPFDINEEKPGLVPSRFHIPAAKDKMQLLHIGQAKFFVYMDEDRGHFQVRTPPAELARSIVDDYVKSQLEYSTDARPALFWVPGVHTRESIMKEYGEVLTEAERQQKNWMTKLCMLADDDWQRYHQHTVISDMQRQFAKTLGWNPIQHPWMSEENRMDVPSCPSCQTSVSIGTVVCPTCNRILDKTKYKAEDYAK